MIAWTGAALVAAGVAAVLLGHLGWPFEIAASLAPQIGAAGLLVAIAAAWRRRAAAAVVSLLLTGLCAVAASETWVPAARPLEARDARIVWANVLTRRVALERVMRLADDVDADVVLIAELPRRLSREELETLAGAYPHRAGRAVADGVNVAAFAREPIGRSGPVGEPAGRRGLALVVPTALGPLQIIGIHSDVPLTPAMQRRRDGMVRRALSLAGDGAPAVLAGDFNTTPWSPMLRTAERTARVRRASLGLASTWLAPVPVLGLPLDHAYAGGGARVSARLGPFVGSDHRPLIIDVALPRSAAAPAG